MEELTKQSNGITLIALVITIIVLLILAAVSIAMLTGENGILTQAQNSKEETRAGAVEEAKRLWETNKALDKNTGSSTAQTLDQLLQDLQNQKLLTVEEVKTVKETGQVSIGSKTIVFGTNAKTLVEAFNDKELNIGDYVDYTPIAGTTSVSKEETGYETTQTYKVDNSTTWRILGLSEDGQHLLLTSGSPLKKEGSVDPYLVLAGAESYYNCETTLDKICGIYKNDLADKVRSMKIEDITHALGVTIDKTNNKAYKTGTQTEVPYEGFFGQSYTYKSGDYAPENYLKATYPNNSKFQAFTNKKVGNKVDGTAYMIQYDSSSFDKESVIYKLLFDGTTEKDNYAKSYWLASPGVGLYSSYAGFGPGAVYGGRAGSGYDTFVSDGYWGAVGFAIRPVVSLKSNITVDDIKVIQGSEEKWTTSGGETYDSGELSGEKGMVEGSEQAS